MTLKKTTIQMAVEAEKRESAKLKRMYLIGSSEGLNKANIEAMKLRTLLNQKISEFKAEESLKDWPMNYSEKSNTATLSNYGVEMKLFHTPKFNNSANEFTVTAEILVHPRGPEPPKNVTRPTYTFTINDDENEGWNLGNSFYSSEQIIDNLFEKFVEECLKAKFN
jgi:hypothetical protein